MSRRFLYDGLGRAPGPERAGGPVHGVRVTGHPEWQPGRAGPRGCTTARLCERIGGRLK
ncbi:hypothetical protein [Streptomyces decoyicus]|uniref:hypothetical protein n=1 Tax=Streptomyces decoyicus TaxID=249567 RepID=UPI0036672044